MITASSNQPVGLFFKQIVKLKVNSGSIDTFNNVDNSRHITTNQINSSQNFSRALVIDSGSS